MSTEHEGHQLIHYTVDHENLHTNHEEMTPNQILLAAQIEAGVYFLVKRVGHEPHESYEGKGDLPIRLHDGDHFISQRQHHHHRIEYTVDAEAQSTTQDQMTPDEILRSAGFDPVTHYLVRLRGNAQKSYQGVGDKPIHVYNHERFIEVSIGPTPLS